MTVEETIATAESVLQAKLRLKERSIRAGRPSLPSVRSSKKSPRL
jgi:hypothetical protein